MSDAVGWHEAIAPDFEAAYARSPRFQERLDVWSDAITRWLKPGGSVLDAGCGPGVIAELALGRAGRLTAFDASPAMTARARRRLAAAPIACEVLDLRLEAAAGLGRFDLVLCSSVLEYVDDLGGALDVLEGLVAPGGVLLVSTPNGDSVYRLMERAAFALTGRPRYLAHVRHRPRPAAVAEALGARGLSPERQVFYGRAPIVSAAVRALGAARLADTLVLTPARRAR